MRGLLTLLGQGNPRGPRSALVQSSIVLFYIVLSRLAMAWLKALETAERQ